jgi:hypothetical protein
MALNICKQYVVQIQQQASRSTATFGPHTVCPLVLLPTSTCLPLISFTPTLIFLACKTACS